MISPLNIVVLISGNGSNLQAIIDAISRYRLPIIIKAVICNTTGAYGLERADKANIPTQILSPADFQDRNAYDQSLGDCIARYNPDLIVLAGFMRILSNIILSRFQDKIINIHPSLLPKYPGLNTHESAVAAGDFEHGCTIHFVNENLDAGPIIAQAAISVKAEDTAETLKAKVHQAEHFLYPTVIHWFAHKRVNFHDAQVYLDNVPLSETGLKFLINQGL